MTSQDGLQAVLEPWNLKDLHDKTFFPPVEIELLLANAAMNALRT